MDTASSIYRHFVNELTRKSNLIPYQSQQEIRGFIEHGPYHSSKLKAIIQVLAEVTDKLLYKNRLEIIEIYGKDEFKVSQEEKCKTDKDHIWRDTYFGASTYAYSECRACGKRSSTKKV